MRHDGVDVGIGDGGVLAAENLVSPEPQGVQQLLLAQLAKKKKKKERVTGWKTVTRRVYTRLGGKLTDALRNPSNGSRLQGPQISQRRLRSQTEGAKRQKRNTTIVPYA